MPIGYGPSSTTSREHGRRSPASGSDYDVTPVRANGPDPDHTLYILVLDRRGITRVLFDSLAQPAAIAHDVRLLLPAGPGR